MLNVEDISRKQTEERNIGRRQQSEEHEEEEPPNGEEIKEIILAL
jgi:hypothetical protein